MADKDKAGEKAAAKAQASAEKELAAQADAGYIGDKADPLDNEAYSLESGADAPSLAEARAALAEANPGAQAQPDIATAAAA